MLRHDVEQLLMQLGLQGARLLDAAALRAHWATRRRIRAAVQGHVSIEGSGEIPVRVAVGQRFPRELPHIFAETGQFLPHVQSDGWVCYRAEEGLVLREGAPGQLLAEALLLAVDTLKAGFRGENWLEVYSELEAYWLDVGVRTSSWVRADNTLRVVQVGTTQGRVRYLADDDELPPDWDARKHAERKHAGLYVPLQVSVLRERISPTQFKDPVWASGFVRRHLSTETSRQLDALLRREKLIPVVALGVPRPQSATRSLVGVQWLGANGLSPLAGGSSSTVEMIAMKRQDTSHLFERGGSTETLRKRSVVVVGCGAVGGYVAMALASSGLGRLVLVDHDKMSPDNMYRHVLGRSGCGKYKVDALKAELERKFPTLDVAVHRTTAESALVEWGRHDVAVATTGDITVSRWLNRHLAALEVPSVFGWLEPLGIGGHALLCNLAGAGCYECLFRDPNGEEVLVNAADFAAEGQSFARTVAGCSSAFTPYGGIDALRTAELIARVTLSALADRDTQHAVHSWKGNPQDFIGNAFVVSPRFGLSETQLHATRSTFVRPKCPVCGGRDAHL